MSDTDPPTPKPRSARGEAQGGRAPQPKSQPKTQQAPKPAGRAVHWRERRAAAAQAELDQPLPVRLLKRFVARPYLAPMLVFALAVVTQSWILGLSFQLDDYRLLDEPFGIFRGNRTAYDAPEAAGLRPFMLRWTAWSLWGLLRQVAGTPVGPLAFHIAGLLLHGATAALLTIAVRRLVRGTVPLEEVKRAPSPIAVTSGVLAGSFFAIAGGGLQAVSWTSAHPDLLVVFFSLASLTLFLRSRDIHHTPLRPYAALALLLALLSKTPATIVWPALAFTLWFTARDKRRRSIEFRWLLAVGAVTAAARWLYLGTLRLRYFETEPPSLRELPQHLLAALELLGQALLPWNRDPLFVDHAPWLGRLVPFAAPIVAACLFGAPLLFGLLRADARTRRQIACGLGLALFLAIPGALLYRGAETNVLSRTVYLPLTALFATQAIAVTAWFRAGRGRGPVRAGVPLVGAGLLLLWSLALVDGRRHVRITEQLASEQRTQTLALVEEAVRTTAVRGGGTLHLLVVLPDAGFGGIPGLGPHVVRATRAPFATVPEQVQFGLSHFPSEEALVAGLPALDLAGATVQAFGPARASDGDVPSGVAAGAIRPWSELRKGWRVVPDLAWALAGEGEGIELWVPAPPIPAHELGGLSATLPPGAAGQGTLTVLQGEEQRPITVAFGASASSRTFTVQPCSTLDERLGEPISGLRWRWGETGAPLSEPPRRAARVPALRVLSPEPEATLSLSDQTPLPTFALDLAQDTLGGARWLRLELSVRVTGPAVAVFSDTPLPPPGTERFEFQPTRVHADPRLAPDQESEVGAPWRAMAQGLRESLAAQGRTETFARWRLTAHHPGGALAAASPYFSIFLRTGPESP